MSAAFISGQDRIPAQLAISMYSTPPSSIGPFTLTKQSERAALYLSDSAAIVAIRGTAINDLQNASDDTVSCLLFFFFRRGRFKGSNADLETVDFLESVAQELGYVALGLVGY
jgi:hypothetical protein